MVISTSVLMFQGIQSKPKFITILDWLITLKVLTIHGQSLYEEVYICWQIKRFNPGSEETRSSKLTWKVLTSVDEHVSSVKNLLTLVLLELSPKCVVVLLEEGNESTIGRKTGSKDPHCLVFPHLMSHLSTQMPSLKPVIYSIFPLKTLKSSFKRQHEFQTLVLRYLKKSVLILNSLYSSIRTQREIDMITVCLYFSFTLWNNY